MQFGLPKTTELIKGRIKGQGCILCIVTRCS